MMRNLMVLVEKHVRVMIFQMGRHDGLNYSDPSHCLRQVPRGDKMLVDHGR